jgi:peptidoglycan-associated lipoprotein
MTKTLKAVAIALLFVLALAAVGCRTKKTPAPVTTPPVTEAAPPVVVPPPPTPVEAPKDFVREEPKVTEEVLPSDIDELNRLAQQRGYIQDAFFAFDESTLSADAQSALTNSANWLKKNSSYGLLIEGHCDERGTEQYNLALGDRRANTAKEYLQTLGIDASRLRTVSYGEERPFDAGHDESAWAKNRRDHLVIIGK